MPFIKINNRNNFKVDKIPNHHPDSIKYETWWRMQKRRCIEGLWSVDDEKVHIDLTDKMDYESLIAKEKGKWRFMPPHLFLYASFGTIMHNPEGSDVTSAKKPMRPYLRDLEWEIFYSWFECKGFSGFEGDEEFTCNRNLKDHLDGDEDMYLSPNVYKKDGTFKEYVPATKYLRQLFYKPLGLSLYENQAKNLFLMGSRGLGKSYLVASGLMMHDILFDGTKRYDEEYLNNPPKAEIFLGAGIASKSSELAEKLEYAVENFPGKWAPNTTEEIQSPLSRTMAGSTKPNNMKNPWRYEYEEKLQNGKWVKNGTKTSMKHGIYTTENPEAAAGGRYVTMVIEEVGLLPNVLTVHGSNTATMLEGTMKFGSAIYIGTGGNMEKVVESEVIFRNPTGYQMLEFEDEWEGSGEIGFFIPAYYALNQYKDKNGNTDEEKALAFLLNKRKKISKNRDVKALQLEMMNLPIKPSEMFLSASGNFFPIEDLKIRLGEVDSDPILLASSWKAKMLIDKEGRAQYALTDKPLITQFPLLRGQDTDGSIELFEMPKKDVHGNIPYGRYIGGTDPVDDDDNSNTSLSLQSTFIFDTFTDRIVAEYTARTRMVEDYYEGVRRLLMFYNARSNYEAQKKGIYGHFKNKNSLHFLAETPKILRDNQMLNTSKVGNKNYGTTANPAVNRYGRDLILAWLNRQAQGKPEGVTNLQTIRGVALLKELISWSDTINADRVSAMGMVMIYREDVLISIETARNRKTNKNKDFWDKTYKLNRR
jgi:hypothetical protein